MARTHCGRRAGVLECTHKYPYWMLAFMIFFTGILYYVMRHFNPVKFIMNVLLTRLTSLILDVPPLFMVMLFLIATGCQDPNAAFPGSIMRNPMPTEPITREGSMRKESPLIRKHFSRSWPSWDWLQPYDPELFLRVDKKEKDGSKGGEIDGTSSCTRPGDLKVLDSVSSLENTTHAHSSLPSQMTKSDHQVTPDQDVTLDAVLRVPTSTRAEAPSKEDERITTFTGHLLKPAVIQGEKKVGNSCVEEFGCMRAKQIEVGVSASCELPCHFQASILGGDNISKGAHESSDVCVDLSSGQGIRPRGSLAVNWDPEPVIKSSTPVPKNSDEHALQEPLKELFHGHQLISVGSLKDWDQSLPDQDAILQEQRDSNEIPFPTTTCVFSSSHPCIRKDEDHVSSTIKAYNELRGMCTAQPGMIKDFNDSNKATSTSSKSKISRVFSFKHMTMKQKGEEKLYWEVRYARPAELFSWRKALPCKAKLESNLFEGIDGSPRAPHALSVDDYKPSAPPFNPFLFYKEILSDKGDILFFKSYEHLTMNEGDSFLFNSLKPTPNRCGNCNRYASTFAG